MFNHQGCVPLLTSEVNGILAKSAESLQQDTALNAKEDPLNLSQHSLGRVESALKILLQGRNYLTLTLAGWRKITNSPFCITTVNKGTQVLFMVEVWGKFRHAAVQLNYTHTEHSTEWGETPHLLYLACILPLPPGEAGATLEGISHLL